MDQSRIMNPDHQENLERTRAGTSWNASWNGHELRRDASDRDWTVWSLVADGGSKGKTATHIVSEIVGASEIGSANGLR
ncbi:hypothetical protein F2Q69_00059926 [Brassica cretica]|uniref:Uncharacterized protein n=1 Tax=Brassica cretica TaxID=69181 RepID=A0A8S9RG74_BRACR|nr:hypothetical protein F2Q69_00059926 [Brassica cretica]